MSQGRPLQETSSQIPDGKAVTESNTLPPLITSGLFGFLIGLAGVVTLPFYWLFYAIGEAFTKPELRDPMGFVYEIIYLLVFATSAGLGLRGYRKESGPVFGFIAALASGFIFLFWVYSRLSA